MRRAENVEAVGIKDVERLDHAATPQMNPDNGRFCTQPGKSRLRRSLRMKISAH